MRLQFSLAIEYTRRRANVTDRWETRLSTIGLLLVGGLVTLVVILLIVPRVVQLIP